MWLIATFTILGIAWRVEGQDRPDIVWMRGGHSTPVSTVAFSPDGRFLLSASWGGNIQFWSDQRGCWSERLTWHLVL